MPAWRSPCLRCCASWSGSRTTSRRKTCILRGTVCARMRGRRQHGALTACAAALTAWCTHCMVHSLHVHSLHGALTACALTACALTAWCTHCMCSCTHCMVHSLHVHSLHVHSLHGALTACAAALPEPALTLCCQIRGRQQEALLSLSHREACLDPAANPLLSDQGPPTGDAAQSVSYSWAAPPALLLRVMVVYAPSARTSLDAMQAKHLPHCSITT